MWWHWLYKKNFIAALWKVWAEKCAICFFSSPVKASAFTEGSLNATGKCKKSSPTPLYPFHAGQGRERATNLYLSKSGSHTASPCVCSRCEQCSAAAAASPDAEFRLYQQQEINVLQTHTHTLIFRRKHNTITICKQIHLTLIFRICNANFFSHDIFHNQDTLYLKWQVIIHMDCQYKLCWKDQRFFYIVFKRKSIGNFGGKKGC